MICYSKFDSPEARYYCRAGYTCCGVRSCCISQHNGLYQTNWFWVVWALIIAVICCCSYAKQRRRNGRMMPFVFYNPRSRSGNESEEELLAGPTDGVFFVPPDGGDQATWAQTDWYKANKPPPYSLVAPGPDAAGAQASSSPPAPPTQPQVVAVPSHGNPSVVGVPSSQRTQSNSVLPPRPPTQPPDAAILQVSTPSEPPPDYTEH